MVRPTGAPLFAMEKMPETCPVMSSHAPNVVSQCDGDVVGFAPTRLGVGDGAGPDTGAAAGQGVTNRAVVVLFAVCRARRVEGHDGVGARRRCSIRQPLAPLHGSSIAVAQQLCPTGRVVRADAGEVPFEQVVQRCTTEVAAHATWARGQAAPRTGRAEERVAVSSTDGKLLRAGPCMVRSLIEVDDPRRAETGGPLTCHTKVVRAGAPLTARDVTKRLNTGALTIPDAARCAGSTKSCRACNTNRATRCKLGPGGTTARLSASMPTQVTAAQSLRSFRQRCSMHVPIGLAMSCVAGGRFLPCSGAANVCAAGTAARRLVAHDVFGLNCDARKSCAECWAERCLVLRRCPGWRAARHLPLADSEDIGSEKRRGLYLSCPARTAISLNGTSLDPPRFAPGRELLLARSPANPCTTFGRELEGGDQTSVASSGVRMRSALDVQMTSEPTATRVPKHRVAGSASVLQGADAASFTTLPRDGRSS